MITTRRKFFGFLAAPAIVRASSLMPIFVPKPLIYSLTGDGIPDGTVITSISVLGNFMTCNLSDGGTIGPLPMPVVPLDIATLSDK